MANETIYIINSTDGDSGKSFAIQPRTFNGYGGVQQSTDLTLYGNAAPTWGERFNENFYHLLENFACPESSINPGNPAGSTELGDGLGINNPVVGQLWFNTNDASYGNTLPKDRMYMYTTSGSWTAVTVDAPVTSVNGKTGAVVLDSSDWPVNTVNGKVGNVVIVASDISDVYSKTEVDNLIAGVSTDYVNVTGDTMTGALKFNTSSVDTEAFIFQHQPNAGLRNLHRFTNVTSGTGSNDGFTVGTQADGTALIENHENAAINFYTNDALRMILQNGGNLSLQSNKIVNVATPTSNLDAANKQYVDTAVTTAIPQVAVLTGTIVNGNTIPLPAGYTEAQCKWTVSPYVYGGSFDSGIDLIVCQASAARVVTAYFSREDSGATTGATAYYMIVGVK